MPRFLLKGIPANILFVLGISLFLIGLTYYKFSLNNRKGKLTRIFCMVGDYSITLLFIEYLFLMIFFKMINILYIIPISLTYLVILTTLIFLWNKYGRAILSIDWIIKRAAGKETYDIV
jgi:hypothetical protein